MGFDFIKKLPTPEEIRNQFPIDAELQAIKDARDKELKDVFTGKSDKFLAIIGPCSADNEDAVLDYLTRLRKVQEKIADKVIIVPRVYNRRRIQRYGTSARSGKTAKSPCRSYCDPQNAYPRYSGQWNDLRRRNVIP